MAQNLLAFHSITGCDTTSFFYGISKKKAYKVYEQDVNLLEGIGEAELTDEKIKLAEVFICKPCLKVSSLNVQFQPITSRGKTFWTLRFSKHQIPSFIRGIRHWQERLKTQRIYQYTLF
jgi:hypothetical protein